MSLFARLVQTLGLQGLRRTTLAAVAFLVLLGGGLLLFSQLPGLENWADGNRAGVASVKVANDADGDGLPAALEEQLGSDPQRYDTLGSNVPDGWLHHWYGDAIDWNDTSILGRPALVPPEASLPESLRGVGAIPMLTVAQLYAAEKPLRIDGAFWLADASLDPSQWDNDEDGVADLWLVTFGLDPFDTDVDAASPGDALFTTRQKYEAGLDPTAGDTDGDGLLDAEEQTGTATLGSLKLRFDPTDARDPSSGSTGLMDGYVVRLGLDPHDAGLGQRTFLTKGLTVLEAFNATEIHCAATPPCDWRVRLDQGPVLDPRKPDVNSDGVPDAWLLRDPNHVAGPFTDARALVLDSTEAWDQRAPDTSLYTGLVLGTGEAKPAPYALTLNQAYSYLRPSTWDEARDGPWFGGLPTKISPAPGLLPPAVALRGWNLTIDVGLGGFPQAKTIQASADPRSVDTDNDTLLDDEEYFGRTRNGKQFLRTNPANPDTDGDGLSDSDEVLVYGTDPRRRDSSSSFLADGEKASYWNARHAAAIKALLEDPVEAAKAYAWLATGTSLTGADLERLKPNGVLVGPATNMLTGDADNDTLRDGAELHPNDHIDLPTDEVRPATDPARVDTDGDTLPDWWEVSWSVDSVFNCGGDCRSPVGVVSGWPLDPSKKKSLPVDGAQSDADINLKGDQVLLAPGQIRDFQTRLAYKYGLDPYRADSNGDKIPDIFAIQWGVEGVPDFAQDVMDEPAHAWTRTAAGSLSAKLTQRGFSAIAGGIAIDPTTKLEKAGPDANLLSTFTDREKGTWIADPAHACSQKALPVGGPRREMPYSSDEDAAMTLDRSSLEAPCWKWVTFNLTSDVAAAVNPWRHDFDGDQIPDAWEAYYGVSRTEAKAVTPGSIASSCQESAGLVACLTLEQSYALGVNPLLKDTDGGGLEDWREAERGLNPRDADDDHAEEIWSGDGLPNRVKSALQLDPFNPDKDHDGLVDGDPLGLYADPRFPEITKYAFLEPLKGNGDLCLRRGADKLPDAVMGHRPVAAPVNRTGSLTWTELHDWYVSLGILHERGTTDPTKSHPNCQGLAAGPLGEPWTLFLREGSFDSERQLFLGAGGGTNSTRPDTNGDGLPDGWIVYYRNHAPNSDIRSRLDPRRDASSDGRDVDFLTFLQNYEAGRPAGWTEALHGPWWGGLDPTKADTDGDRGWFAEQDAIDADDWRDVDLDNDGLPDDEDPVPGVDAQNRLFGAPPAFNTTDFARLWTLLAQRASSFALDNDGDRVPDPLDRARIQITDLTAAPAVLQKAGGTLAVTGKVKVSEPKTTESAYAHFPSPQEPAETSWAPDGSAVEGLTVKVYLVDARGLRALAGVNFTDALGRFDVSGQLGSAIQVPTTPVGGALVEGHQLPGGQATTLSSLGSGLAAGTVRVEVEVEPIDARLQPIKFHSGAQTFTHARANKSTPFSMPAYLSAPGQSDALRAVVRQASDPQPDLGVPHVRHAANATFGAVSQAAPITLQSATSFTLTPPPVRVRQGEPLLVRGLLLDAGLDPLAGGKRVRLDLEQTGVTTQTLNIATDHASAFTHAFETTSNRAGLVKVRVTAIDWTEANLAPPSPAILEFTLARDSAWDPSFILGGKPLNAGEEADTDADAPPYVKARLQDHQGQAVPGQPVQVRVIALDVTPLAVNTVTDSTGFVNVTLPRITGALPLGALEVNISIPTIAPDHHTPLRFFIKPKFATQLALAAVSVNVGEPARVTGTLMRAGGTPVHDLNATIVAVANDGTTFTALGTGPDGKFSVAIPNGRAGQLAWTARFLGLPQLLPSPTANTTSLHFSETRVSFYPSVGLRGSPVAIEGRLEATRGGLASGTLILAWSDLPDSAQTVPSHASGIFETKLPARNASGSYEVVAEFKANQFLGASKATTVLKVLVPTQWVGHSNNVTVHPDASSTGPLVVANLTDEQGRQLSGRGVRATVRAPGSGAFEIDLITDAQGTVRLHLKDVPADRPGTWRIHLAFPGGTLEAAAHGNWTSNLTYEAQLAWERIPSGIFPGEETSLRASVKAASANLGAIRLKATLAGSPLAEGAAFAQGTWDAPIAAPPLRRGLHRLELTGEGASGVIVLPALGDLRLLGGVDVELSETNHTDGSRTIKLRVVDAETGAPMPGLTIVLVRDDPAGSSVRYVDTTGSDGAMALDLGDAEGGQMRVVAVGGKDLRVSALTFNPIPIEIVPDDGSIGPAAWLTIAAAALLLMAVGVGGSYLAWTRAKRNALLRVLEDAERRLLDPRQDPLTVIRAAYRRVLRTLEGAGYRPAEAATVRDICREATTAFQIPTAPMSALSAMFEVATYGDAVIPAADRARALAALREINGRMSASPAMGGPVR